MELAGVVKMIDSQTREQQQYKDEINGRKQYYNQRKKTELLHGQGG
jgi:hypothetical protein